MKKIAIFDVDYTIIKKESLMQLILYIFKKNKTKYLKNLIIGAFSGILYLFKIYDERKVKEKTLSFLKGIKKQKIEKLSREFFKDVLKNILYKDALNMIRKLKKEGYEIYLITASPEFYMNQFYNINEVDKVIGTKFSYTDKDEFTGKMEGNNCKGEEKVLRLITYLTENNICVDFRKSYMFSDSLSDKPLLDMTGNSYLINFNRKSYFNVLKWK
ncbi:HAD-IB family hydrolase [Clostridium sp. BJN0001]|uniref:HAD-IB family hydrolase n=1 Tax=Clostridium sp. BJN0001 TaxID=2930219 RepID=UPI001FD496CB|nr:HAD-IB family hydrolase [Clostridium sp. BJN0001]